MIQRRLLITVSWIAALGIAIAIYGFAIGMSRQTPVLAAAGPCPTPSVDLGSVTQVVTVQTAGTYQTWARLAAATASSNTYLLEIDGQQCVTVGGANIPTYASGATSHFTNSPANWTNKSSDGQTINVTLTTGSHTFKSIGNASGLVLDRVILTQDAGCIPSGTGDNCTNPPDTIAPIVSITSPASNSTLSSASTPIVAHATDDTSVSKVEFYLNGAVISTDTTADANSDYTYTLSQTTLTPGTYQLLAKAYDQAGNVTASGVIRVIVPDKTAPTVTLTNPQEGATISGSTTLQATAQDNVKVTKVDFFVDGVQKGTTIAAGAGNSFSISLDTTSLADGNRTISAKAFDAAGNSKASNDVRVAVSNPTAPSPDTTPPSIQLGAPVANATISGSFVMSATASDTRGVKQVQFYVDNVLKTTDTSAPYSATIDTKTLSNGSHSFRAVATDTSNLQGTTPTVNATVKNSSHRKSDINQDGIVNILDFGLLKVKFSQKGTAIGGADINGDGVVDIRDFSILRTDFGTKDA